MGKRKAEAKTVQSKKGITRRDFVKGTVAAGVAASVGCTDGSNRVFL